MTRAQNHLYIIGSGKEKDFTFDQLSKQNTYLKLIFYALGENFTSQVFSQELVESKNATFTVITEAEDSKAVQQTEIFDEEKKEDENSIEKMDEFYSFVYPEREFCKLSYKNSVTGATKLNLEEYSNAGEILFEDGEMADEKNEELRLAREKAVEIGNSYHEALKIINFDNVENFTDLEKEFNSIKHMLQDGYADNIDLNLLLKNILIIKQVVGSNDVYKEREFIMQCSPEEVAPFAITTKATRGQTLIVQGIVDLFAIGEKLVLVDYKYTSTKDEKMLIQGYQGQIDLYEKALSKAFGRKVDEKYLLSLKEGKLIKID